MVKIVSSIFLFAGLTIQVFGISQGSKYVENYGFVLRKYLQEFGSQYFESADYNSYDLIYQRMEWNVDPAVRYIIGKITSHIRSLVDDLSYIDFDLDTVMQVDSVWHDGSSVKFIHENNMLRIY